MRRSPDESKDPHRPSEIDNVLPVYQKDMLLHNMDIPQALCLNSSPRSSNLRGSRGGRGGVGVIYAHDAGNVALNHYNSPNFKG